MALIPFFSTQRTPSKLAIAVHLLLCGAPLFAHSTATAAETAAVAATKTYAIPAGPLNQQLNQFAAQSGVYLVGDAQLATGKTGPSLQGNYSVDGGFSALLAGSGLQVIPQPNGAWRLQRIPQGDEMLVVAGVNRNGVTEGTQSYTTRSMNTATQLNLSPRETPQSVSVVTRQRMDDQNMTSLDEAMKQTTGINVVNQNSFQVKYESRAFAMDNIKEDGVNQSSQNSVMNAFQSTSESPDLAIYDRVEVLRGASGLTQGSGEPGGTVNLVRKKPTYEFQASASAGIGSWDNYRSEIDVSGPLNDDASLRGRLVGVYQDKQSFTDYVGSERKVLFGTLAWDITPDTTVTTGMNWQKTDVVPDLYGVPFGTDKSNLHLPRSTFLGASWNRINFERINPFAELEHRFSNDWTLKSALNYTRATSKERYIGIMNGTAGVNPQTGVSRLNNALHYDNKSDQWGYNLSVSGPFELLGRSHELVFGGDYQKENFDNAIGRIANTTSANIYNWDPNSVAEPDWSNLSLYSTRYREQYNIYQRGLFATTRWELADDWKLILGGRYSAYSYDYYYDNQRNTSDKEYSSLHVRDQFVPYSGLLWNFADHYTWYASYAEIYKPQSARDKNNNLLPAITGTNYETGVKGEFFDGDLNASLALFRIIQSNRALAEADSSVCQDPNGGCSRAEGKVRSQGVELDVTGKLAEGWQVQTGYTLTNSKYLEASESDKAAQFSPRTPKHMFKLYTSYNLPGELNQWTIGAGMTAQTGTQTYPNRAFGLSQGGYTLLNANVRYQYSKNLSFNLVGNNLTDKTYFLNLNNRHRSGNNYYGDPRNFMLTAKWNF
ncbi:TonB-dependent siderophore receptor [Pectobacterium aroidearum]|uniref:TonB-dependent siderophore receptor n=2 Tax=Pectobacterium aroidearum TaxID=1201031 RepID=UPI002115730E|nr:TonB-dependent receptor [Pectobacterium aroidearum]UUE35665.1 TonB-dependent receptor [Pectobacterium aroidearum]UUE40039.1 TonB-dependent receptor [Pectobacterium aroidearum]UUE44369.1 TonB-dependent receptor [Pectobacterium aroidearum]UUE48587.1 TonB-dependent receptor [Pectobacterium aroidearum]UUE52792.1 TonB-dependent receptor [Pectobacterium aroidearum]